LRTRSGIILIKDGNLALIERHRLDGHYFSFPGGGVDEGESLQEAAIREAKEELGLFVVIKQKAAEVHFGEKVQHYFLVEGVGGEFGSGTGEEYGEYNPIHGTYYPIWMPLADVPDNNVVPHELAELVVHAEMEGWHSEPVIIIGKP
jgi:8-oxo-dGTP pyrophosphatase MutT (NUDIX family)